MEKAFDWINRDMLEIELLENYVNGNCFKCIKKMYQNSSNETHKQPQYALNAQYILLLLRLSFLINLKILIVSSYKFI